MVADRGGSSASERPVEGGEWTELRHRQVSSSTSSSGTTAASLRKASQVSTKSNTGGEREHKPPHLRVVHHPQDSLFSSSSGWTNYRGFFNLSVLLLVVSNGRVALENLIKYGILISPLQWISYFFTDAWHSPWSWPNLGLILFSTIAIVVVFITEKLLEKGWLGNRFAAVFYPLLIGTHLAVPAICTLILNGNPLYSASALIIYVIESLKLVSYVHVNYWCRSVRAEEEARKKGGKEEPKGKKKEEDKGKNVISKEEAAAYPNTLTLSNLLYFIVAPTLCYELKFPRSPRRRKTFLAKRFAELIFLSFLIVALCQQWVVPLLKNSLAPFSEMDIGRCVERLLKLAIPNHLIWLLFFYTVFHSSLNLIAEILRFADREFYRDFWNSETISYFWKTWNIPVHRWALRHIYLPIVRNGYGKWTATLAVFFVSAFLHEYLVSVPLHMFRLWAYYGMMAQIPLAFITDHVVHGGRAGNIVVWLSLILGQPMAVLMYVHDWYLLNYPHAVSAASAR